MPDVAPPAAAPPPVATPPVAAPPAAPPPPPRPGKPAAAPPVAAAPPAASGAPPADAAAPPPPKAAALESHEAFLAAVFPEDDPIMRGGHKGLPAYEKLLEVMPEEGRKWAANLRADYTRKTTELATEREANRRVLATEREQIAAERTRLASLATPEFQAHLAELKSKAAGADPFTKEGQEAIAEAKAVELYERMIKPIQDQVAAEARKAKLRAYVSANADFEDPETRKGVMAILEAKPHLDLEEAHDLWRGHRARKEATRLQGTLSAADQERARTLALTGSGGLANTETAAPKTFKNALEAEKYWRSQGMT